MDPFAELPPGEPCSPSPGLVVARRGFLGTVAAALAAARLPGSRGGWQDRAQPARGFTVAEFVAEVEPVCRELVADTSRAGQDRYLLALASHAVRLCDVPFPPDANQVKPGHRIGSNHGPDPFTVLHWELEPGVRIQPHAHTYGNVVTLGMSGSALLQNFEMVGARDYDSTEPFVVQCVQEQVLRTGDVDVVNLERHYVHGFTAGPDGARGLDITTRILPRRKAPVLQLGDPIDANARTFHARWV